VGAGFKFLDNYALNYVFSPYGILGATHKAEISISFGGEYGAAGVRRDEYYADKYEATELNMNRNISYLLPVPDGLTARKENGKLILSWNPVSISDAQYNIYVQIKGRTGIVKINDAPLKATSYSFKPSVSGLKLKFYVCLVKDIKESEFSKPLEMTYTF
jgi:hypothetical protein